ncbi:hypothetical protein QNJ39_10725 [Macrococcus caseolyticus]|uniref:hypothetical protein n=1 Tax=Macrococcoides caseolyticum TaxID=69966 RepID=UPI0024BD4E1D|nr:hypothetical protein [Macrococcus caseolyticus]MDJ1092059.1 hypothetical protein [Macrococcus caseolyticus]
MSDLKSVSDLAKELGVQRQAIFYHKNKLGMSFEEIEGKSHLTPAQEEQILKHMNVKPKEKKPDNSTRNDLIERLTRAESILDERERVIKSYEERLKDKDEVIMHLKSQIDVLNTHIKDSNTLVRNQQSLMLEHKEKTVQATYSDVKEASKESEVQRENNVSSNYGQKKGFWNNLFNK